MVVCDTCGRETDKVYRVVVDHGYDRSVATPRYNCRDCYERKNAEREGGINVTAPAEPTKR